MLFVFFKH